ncbi:DUF4377 domain-containing protein [Sulfidibacter corallicola]|uniref:DUF4377 domain-containing protein n=1 Tax=Sulfidibacter corallicola TaxID=2818388 RepID=UPI003075D422
MRNHRRRLHAFFAMGAFLLFSMVWALATHPPAMSNAVQFAPANTATDATPLVKEFFVDHYKRYSGNLDQSFCLQVRESPLDRWRDLDEPIIGFDYQWGFEYKIVVALTHSEPADESAKPTWTLVEVLSKERVAPETTFELKSWAKLDRPLTSILRPSGIRKFHLMNELAFSADHAIASQLHLVRSHNADVTIRFRHGHEDMPRAIGLTVDGMAVPTLSAWAIVLMAVFLATAALILSPRRKHLHLN